MSKLSALFMTVIAENLRTFNRVNVIIGPLLFAWGIIAGVIATVCGNDALAFGLAVGGASAWWVTLVIYFATPAIFAGIAHAQFRDVATVEQFEKLEPLLHENAERNDEDD